MTNLPPHPLILIILDGWGYRQDGEFNAISAAHTPTWDAICQHYPHTLIEGSGHAVGLPNGQMGNSEVGHLNMGAGRIVLQDLTKIDTAIETGEFFTNKTLIAALKLAEETKKAVHIMGLLSPGGVHSHEAHIQALLTLTTKYQIDSVYLHPFLDGRDTPPQSAMASLIALDEMCLEFKRGKIASIIGRYYAMDRDKRWERVKEAYDLLASGKARYHAPSAEAALSQAYARGETDEFVKATAIHLENTPPVTIQDGDIVIYMNFRSDRARELTEAFISPDFNEFLREPWPSLGMFVCLSEYDSRFNVPVAFPPQSLNNIFAEYISKKGLKQLRIAETEKYAHVTFFFNGGIEKPYAGEDRVLIPSLKIPTYDMQPQMSAPEIAERLVAEIKSEKYAAIICNFANADMVGHSGNFDATKKAVETIDACLAKIIRASDAVGGEILITADHGNAEMMFDKSTNQPHTAHTSDPVPFVYIGRKAEIVKKDGKLSDIAPTMLYLMGLSIPEEMTGASILKLL